MQVKHLKDAELQGEERAKPKRPRALVLGPTRELTDQILGVAKSMSHFAKFRSACVNGGAALRLTALHLAASPRRKAIGLLPAATLLGAGNLHNHALLRETLAAAVCQLGFKPQHMAGITQSRTPCTFRQGGVYPAYRRPLRYDMSSAGGTFGQQAQTLAQPLDILIGTPQKLMQHAEKGNLFWGDVQYVVMDEADTMFDKGFGPEVRAVLSPLRSKAQPAKAVLVVATLSKVRLEAQGTGRSIERSVASLVGLLNQPRQKV